jgi:hypothetical protein
MKKTALIQNIIRTFGAIQFVMGIIFWTGHLDDLVIVHIILGSVITIGLIILSIQAARNGVSKWLVVIGIVWAIGLPVWGLLQEEILPGSYNWITQVLHLLCGIGAVGLAEILGKKIKSA